MKHRVISTSDRLSYQRLCFLVQIVIGELPREQRRSLSKEQRDKMREAVLSWAADERLIVTKQVS